MKSMVAERLAGSMRMATRTHGAVVHLVGEGAVLQHVDDPAHLLLGVVLDVAHVGVDDVEAEVRDHLAQLLRALLVGGDLRAQVGEVLLGIAGGVAAGGQQRAHLRLAEAALLDQQRSCRSARPPRRCCGCRAASSRA